MQTISELDYYAHKIELGIETEPINPIDLINLLKEQIEDADNKSEISFDDGYETRSLEISRELQNTLKNIKCIIKLLEGADENEFVMELLRDVLTDIEQYS